MFNDFSLTYQPASTFHGPSYPKIDSANSLFMWPQPPRFASAFVFLFTHWCEKRASKLYQHAARIYSTHFSTRFVFIPCGCPAMQCRVACMDHAPLTQHSSSSSGYFRNYSYTTTSTAYRSALHLLPIRTASCVVSRIYYCGLCMCAVRLRCWQSTARPQTLV